MSQPADSPDGFKKKQVKWKNPAGPQGSTSLLCLQQLDCTTLDLNISKYF